MGDCRNGYDILKCQVKHISCYDATQSRESIQVQVLLTAKAIADRCKALYTFFLERLNDFV